MSCEKEKLLKISCFIPAIRRSEIVPGTGHIYIICMSVAAKFISFQQQKKLSKTISVPKICNGDSVSETQ